MNTLAILALWLAGGVAIGLVYFRLVRRSADLMTSGLRGRTWLGAALVPLRMAALGAGLGVAVLQGPGPLLAAALGLLIGRSVMMRRLV